MWELLQNFLTSSPFIPHGHCYLWKPGLVWLHVISDTLIALAYYSIPLTLFNFVKKREDLPFDWIFLLFAAFIVACGTTHLMEVWTLWHPIYWQSGTIKAITAIVSLYAAIALVYLLPKALQLPSPAQLETANQELQKQITSRQNTEAALRKTRDELEIRVQERTAELLKVNQSLQAEIAERERAELALRESEERWLLALRGNNDGIWDWNVKTSEVFFSTRWKEMLGYEEHEITNNLEEWAKRVHPDDVGWVTEVIQDHFAKKTPFYISEHRVLCKDGTYKWILDRGQALWDEAGNPVRMTGSHTDITDRKRAEVALRESEERFHQAFEYAAIGMALVSLDGSWLQVNHSLCEMVGYCEQELLATTYHAITHPDDLDADLSYQHQILAGEIRTYQTEKRYLHKQGQLVWVLVNVSLVRNENNQPNYFVFQIENISDRKQAEEELRHLSKALSSAVEGISYLDTQGRYIKVNPAYASMVGYQPEELIGTEWQLTVHPSDQEKTIAAYHQMLANGKVEVEAKAVRKDGSVFDKQVVMVKAYNPQQEFIGHYCFMKDISDRLEIARLKDEFVSVVSHELRTPLTSISGALDLLASGILQTEPEDAQRMLNIAANNTDRLVRLINDILDIERIESGKIQMTKLLCDATDLMTSSVETMQEMAEQAGVTLSVSSLNARLWVDPDRIIQVFTNLLSNAIKFSPPNSTVWLSAEIQEAESSSPYILFKVKDTGRGIPVDKIESIFERFQQVDASDSRQKGGTGLGLAICRSILQHHGGQIWAESTLGSGSTFFFTLPLLRSSQSGVNIDDPDAPLIVECDDDPDLRVVLQSMLERQGYRVLSVGSGLEAVEQAVRLHPAVIILNLMMPGMDGWETLAMLKQQRDTQNIPVIILSGLSPDLNQNLPPGVSDWIVKPPNLKLLCQALEKALAKQNQSIKVLIVEDDQDLAEVIIAMFHRHDIETCYAQTGREAIQISQQIIPDLLVLDLGLPEYDGFAVVDWLRQHNRLCRVPLVVYTAQDLDYSDREKLKLGQTIFLTKGRISPQEFEQRVISLLNRMVKE